MSANQFLLLTGVVIGAGFLAFTLKREKVLAQQFLMVAVGIALVGVECITFSAFGGESNLLTPVSLRDILLLRVLPEKSGFHLFGYMVILCTTFWTLVRRFESSGK